MQERYRVRDAKVVQLTYSQLHDLADVKSTTVDIDGMDIEFRIDGFEPMDDSADRTLTLSEMSIDRMMSGFMTRFFGVFGEYETVDCILTAEDRVEHELDMEERADGLIEDHIAQPDLTIEDIHQSDNLEVVGDIDETLDASDEPVDGVISDEDLGLTGSDDDTVSDYADT